MISPQDQTMEDQDRLAKGLGSNFGNDQRELYQTQIDSHTAERCQHIEDLQIMNDGRGKTDLYKTVICQAWLESTLCIFGGNCKFAHGKDELQPMPLVFIFFVICSFAH